MTALLYYSISSDLTEDEIIEINKKVENLTPLLITQSKDILFSEIICG